MQPASAIPSGKVPTGQGGWQARLQLEFAQRGDSTRLAGRRHQGPLVVQKPFYPEGGVCHVYVLHPPGGVVGGDRLELEVTAGDATHALLTTPASAKFYRSAGEPAQQIQQLRVGPDAILEWLPQDTILFSGSQVELASRIELSPGARFIGWEILDLGRPWSGEKYTRGGCRQSLEMYRDGRPVLIERLALQAGDPLLEAQWGLARNCISGTLLATPASDEMLEAVRDLAPAQGESFSATRIRDVLVCRYLGQRAEGARQTFIAAWERLRPLLLQRPACPPRIWAT